VFAKHLLILSESINMQLFIFLALLGITKAAASVEKNCIEGKKTT
jgi:hypothetical protein